MRNSTWIRGAAAFVLAAIGATAWAQDYAVAPASGQWISPPFGATDLLPSFANNVDGSRVVAGLPFAVSYFGHGYSSMSISTNGFVQFGGGQASGSTFAAFPQSAGNDGICAAAWGTLDATVAGAHLYTWTDGVAPARRFVVAWANFGDRSGGTLSVQEQFYEDSGAIVFARGPVWTATVPFAVGLDAVTSPATGNDASYVTPDGSTLFTFTGAPPSDVQFAPADDADEPNGDAAHAVFIGQVGVARRDLALRLSDEDWYRFQVVKNDQSVIVDVNYDSANYASTLALELRTMAGDVVATGAPTVAGGPFRLTSAALPAGDYVVRLAHLGGRALVSYALDVYARLDLQATAATTWTAGVPFSATVAPIDGVGPYALSSDPYYPMPTGLSFDAAQGRITGTPFVPGTYDYVVICRDSASPTNTVTLLQKLVVNPPLELKVSGFLAFALGKPLARSIPADGGTAPFVCTTTSGTLPSGVTLDPSGLRFSGAPDQAGSSSVSVTASDAVGAQDVAATTAVVCTPLGAMQLAAGASAAGVYFDAVEGSTISLTLSTDRKQEKRLLRASLLASDGTTATAAKATGGLGKASIAKFVVPTTGRYYFVVAADTGGLTHLTPKAKIAPPTRGTGRADGFQNGDRLEVDLGVVGGAVATFTAKPDRSGLRVVIQSLVDPSGNTIPLTAADVKTSKAGVVTLKRKLDVSGTWTVVVVGADAGPGRVTYTYSIAQPKKTAYSAD